MMPHVRGCQHHNMLSVGCNKQGPTCCLWLPEAAGSGRKMSVTGQQAGRGRREPADSVTKLPGKP